MIFLETIAQSTDGWSEFSFAHPASRYKVKNFTDGDIFVSFSEKADDDTTDDCQKLPKDFCDEFEVKTFKSTVAYPARDEFSIDETDIVYIHGTGNVEVSQM